MDTDPGLLEVDDAKRGLAGLKSRWTIWREINYFTTF